MADLITRVEFFQLGGSTGSLSQVPNADVDLAITGARDQIYDYLHAHNTLPLVTLPANVKQWQASIASFNVLSSHGFTDKAQSEHYQARYIHLIGNGSTPGLLDKYATGELSMGQAVDSTTGTYEGGPTVKSGWIKSDGSRSTTRDDW